MYRLGFVALGLTVLLGSGGVAFESNAEGSCELAKTSPDLGEGHGMCRERTQSVRTIAVQVGSVADVEELQDGYASLNTRGYNYVSDDGFRPPVAHANSEPPKAAKRN